MDYIHMPSLAILVSAVLGFIVRTGRQTESHTYADDRLTHATVVVMSRE